MEKPRILNKRYELLEPLGKGGMAIIYKGRDIMLERPIAIKLLREDYSQDPVFQDRFRLEARAAANLSHPNIVTVHDFGLDKGRLYIIMEFIPGTDLKALLQEKKSLPINDALPIMIQACAGIGYAHRAGLVHCDVKPQNLLVMPDMRVKVTDFGIARAMATIHADEHTDLVWGSPQYFAPEQASGSAPSPASDVYSLGVVLYELLTGNLPFHADDPNELANQHVNAEPPGIRSKLPDTPVELEQVLLKVLAKEPSQRYRTADQLGRVLSSLLPQKHIPSLSLTSPEANFQTGTVRTIHQGEPGDSGSTSPSALAQTQPKKSTSRDEGNPNIDWISAGLGLIALVAVLGLVPFWFWVYFVYNPPIR